MSGGSYLLLVVCGSLLLDSAFGAFEFINPASDAQPTTLAEGVTEIYTATAAVATGDITYTIASQTPAGTFTIATGGVISLASGQTLDFEQVTSHKLILVATDAGGDNAAVTTTGTLTITVTDTNDNSPVFGETSYCATVATSAVVDTSVGVYTATDADASTTLTYSIDATGNTGTKFKIGADATLKTAATFASTDPKTYTLIVVAKDTDATNSGSATVSVYRDGSCNAAPAFASASMATGVTMLLLLSKLF